MEIFHNKFCSTITRIPRNNMAPTKYCYIVPFDENYEIFFAYLRSAIFLKLNIRNLLWTFEEKKTTTTKRTHTFVTVLQTLTTKININVHVYWYSCCIDAYSRDGYEQESLTQEYNSVGYLNCFPL